MKLLGNLGASAGCVGLAIIGASPSVLASENQFVSGILEFSDILIPDKTYVTVGAGPILRPDYIGSDDYEVAVEPALYLRFEGIFTFENDGAAINLLGLEDFEFGPTARFTRGRNENDDAAPMGLGDIGLSFDLGLYAKAKIMDKVTSRVRYTHAVINNSNGGLLDIRVSSVLYRKNKVMLAGAVGIDWLTGGRAQRFFAVNAAQSEGSGNSTYTLKSGFRDLNINLLAQWQFSQKWSVSGFSSYMRLIGDAANSPIVAPVGSVNQFTVGAYLAYRFSISSD